MSTGHFAEAEKMIEEHKDLEESKIRFLYFVNAGLIEHLNGEFEKSNEFFEKAEEFVEMDKKKVVEEGAALLVNPKLSTYRGEDHEILLINYYKALNYYLMNNLEDALVEVRRMDLSMQKLSEKYKSETKYKEDAYMHLLMGFVYEADGNHNDAFIAFRNAYDIYEKVYQKEYGVFAPEQLKYDLIRSAHMAKMREEQVEYETLFKMKFDPTKEKESSVIVLWNNGMGPVKEEWGINFVIMRTGGGWITFVNKEFGLSFPFYAGDNDLNGMAWIKVVFPRYVERKEVFTSASILSDSANYNFEIAENLNKISFKVLNERMLLEFGKGLLRVALKQVAAQKIGESQDSPALGAALSIAASASESADTRNWQTLPHSMYYTRVPVSSGDQELTIQLKGQTVEGHDRVLKVNTKPGQTILYPFWSLAAQEPVTLNRAK